MRLCLILTAVIVALLALGAATMPESFYAAMARMPNTEAVCVKNYDVGASITEAYWNFDYLNKETQMVSRTYNSTEGRAILEASINSEGIGQAHLAWQSKDPIHDNRGHHALIGESAEDLTGVFSIGRFILLWSNSIAANSTSLYELPCP